MTSSYEKELRVAELAVRRAAILTQKVFLERVRNSVEKKDRSPVTIADFGSQALIISIIHKYFPEDRIIGEEESSMLRENATMREQILQLVSSKDVDLGSALDIAPAIETEDQLLKVIDLGKDEGGSTGRRWALDPIDGTQGFLAGQQYAIALALLVDGVPEVGVLCGPNFPSSDSQLSREESESLRTNETRGLVMSAVRGFGCYESPIGSTDGGDKVPVKTRRLEGTRDAIMCESVGSHVSHDKHAAIAESLGITNSSVRMDSACKYMAVARGSADIYLRLSRSSTYEECIWDHASGYVIINEAGGTVKDVQGNEIDFSLGRTLKKNKGLLVCAYGLYPDVAKAVQTGVTS